MFANVYVIYATAAAIFAYVLPHMIHSALTNQILQRGYRYPFLSGVYETVLSWYILLPTTVLVCSIGLSSYLAFPWIAGRANAKRLTAAPILQP